MSVSMNVYCVTGKTMPYTNDMVQEVGYYTTKETARKVCDFVRDLNIREIPGGVDVLTEKLRAEVIECDAGLRLKETPGGCITMVHKELDSEEYQRLKNFKFRFEQPQILDFNPYL